MFIVKYLLADTRGIYGIFQKTSEGDNSYNSINLYCMDSRFNDAASCS